MTSYYQLAPLKHYLIVINQFCMERKRAAPIRIIKNMPDIGPPESENIRKYILHKFPYKVLYSIEKDHLYIIAIAHMHREPMYWINRIKPNK